jgi:hypothetical protein
MSQSSAHGKVTEEAWFLLLILTNRLKVLCLPDLLFLSPVGCNRNITSLHGHFLSREKKLTLLPILL